MVLREYQAKRDFRKTPEPGARITKGHRQPIFVVQEHHATRLHYDFRLEADGVLKSWAVPKQPSQDPAHKRLAVHVEDHPVAYASFEGNIPEGQYGAGTVKVWDKGTYENLMALKPAPKTVSKGIEAGRLEFVLHGEKLQGRFALVRMGGGRSGKKDNWLLIKMKDEFAQRDPDVKQETARPAKPRARTPVASPVRQDSIHSSLPANGVAFTHTDRIVYPDPGITKGEVLDFYRRMAPRLLPYLRDRPVTLERLPQGLGDKAPRFWQKDTPAYYPNWIPRADLSSERGKVVHYVLVNSVETLLYLVNQNALTFHVWFSRVKDLDRPDFVLFDLDPGEATFVDAVLVARELHALLSRTRQTAFVKTSGKTGLHVLVPWQETGGYDEARSWAQEVAAQVAADFPDRATVEVRKAKRGRRVYVDVMQNARGHHAVPPYVLRAVPRAPVSTPLNWRELGTELDPGRFNLRTIFRRLARQERDPMADLLLPARARA
jgi:bifunctional non-homologous end joining protein LigD